MKMILMEEIHLVVVMMLILMMLISMINEMAYFENPYSYE